MPQAGSQISSVGPGANHGHHQLDDVPGGPELAVDPSRGDLGQQVLVQVAVRVAVSHRDVVEHVDDLGQEGGRWDREPRVPHVVGVGRVVTANLLAVLLEKGEHLAGEGLVHDVGVEVLEPAPAQVRLAVQEFRILDHSAGYAGLLLGEGLQVV